MKREIDLSDAVTAAEGSRPKRRKEGVGTQVDMDASMATVGSNETDDGGQEEPESVKEQGLRLWQIVKDAVNKECVFPALFDPLAFISAILSLLQYSRGRTLSIEFLKKPPKRQYPDYYQIIQKPIALEDIKKQLDNNAYQTLEAARADFELCFTNAKTYNMKESEIWKDAKDLLVSKLNYATKKTQTSTFYRNWLTRHTRNWFLRLQRSRMLMAAQARKENPRHRACIG